MAMGAGATDQASPTIRQTWDAWLNDDGFLLALDARARALGMTADELWERAWARGEAVRIERGLKGEPFSEVEVFKEAVGRIVRESQAKGKARADNDVDALVRRYEEQARRDLGLGPVEAGRAAEDKELAQWLERKASEGETAGARSGRGTDKYTQDLWMWEAVIGAVTLGAMGVVWVVWAWRQLGRALIASLDRWGRSGNALCASVGRRRKGVIERWRTRTAAGVMSMALIGMGLVASFPPTKGSSTRHDTETYNKALPTLLEPDHSTKRVESRYEPSAVEFRAVWLVGERNVDLGALTAEEMAVGFLGAGLALRRLKRRGKALSSGEMTQSNLAPAMGGKSADATEMASGVGAAAQKRDESATAPTPDWTAVIPPRAAVKSATAQGTEKMGAGVARASTAGSAAMKWVVLIGIALGGCMAAGVANEIGGNAARIGVLTVTAVALLWVWTGWKLRA